MTGTAVIIMKYCKACTAKIDGSEVLFYPKLRVKSYMLLLLDDEVYRYELLLLDHYLCRRPTMLFTFTGTSSVPRRRGLVGARVGFSAIEHPTRASARMTVANPNGGFSSPIGSSLL